MCRRNILQDINNTCTFHKIRNPRCPIFRLGDIFQETGDNFSEVAIQVCAVRCGVGAGRWKMSNGHESGPRGLKSMAPFTEHLVNPCTMPRLFSTLPHLIPQRASREIPRCVRSCGNCWNRLPRTWWLKKHTFLLSFWRSEGQNQGPWAETKLPTRPRSHHRL